MPNSVCSRNNSRVIIQSLDNLIFCSLTSNVFNNIIFYSSFENHKHRNLLPSSEKCGKGERKVSIQVMNVSDVLKNIFLTNGCMWVITYFIIAIANIYKNYRRHGCTDFMVSMACTIRPRRRQVCLWRVLHRRSICYNCLPLR